MSGPATAKAVEDAVRAGDVAGALRLADAVLADPDAPDRDRAVAALAAAYAARGLWSSTADLYSSLPGTDHRFLAAVALLVTGAVAAAEQAREDADSQIRDAPSPFTRGLQLLAAGLRQTLEPAAVEALARLTEATELTAARPDALVPDSAHAVAAVVACEAHEFDAAEILLSRAVAQGVGGALLGARHHLLAAWVAMRAGDWARAQAALASADAGALEPRDGLVASAVDAGLALRTGDLDRLVAARRRVLDAVTLHPVDVLALPFFAELFAAATRLEAIGDLRRQSAAATELLERIGPAPLWRLSATWSTFRAAATGGNAVRAKELLGDLLVIDPPLPRLEPLREAAMAWCATLQGNVDRARVEDAAAALESVGLRWEAAQVVGAAAVRSDDSTVARALLARARDLRSSLPSLAGDAPGAVALTEREREIGACVLDGLSYKEIGEHLYISAKTVEHHVARIKSKVGATTRAEMLALLRKTLRTDG